MDLLGMLNVLSGLYAADPENITVQEGVAAALCLPLCSGSNIAGKVLSFPNLPECLAVSLSKDQNPALQTIATWALGNLACGSDSLRKRIFNLPGLVEKLVKAMGQDQNAGLADVAAKTIHALTDTTDSTMKAKLARFPNLLVGLATSLSKGQNPALQVHAAQAVGSLVIGDESNTIKKRIINVPGMLENHIRLIDQDHDLSLVEMALFTIYMLAEDSTTLGQIAGVPNLLESMAASFSKGLDSDLKTHVAGALVNMVANDVPMRTKVFNSPGLPDNLIKSMGQNQEPDIAEQAAYAIYMLTSLTDLRMQGQINRFSNLLNDISSFPNLLASLGASLLKGQNPGLQRYAAYALAHLAIGQRPVKERLCNPPGLVKILVRSINQVQNANLAGAASFTILILTATKDFSNLIITLDCFPNLLRNLGKSLSKEQNIKPSLQEHAAHALANLALVHQSIKEQIFNLPGLQENLAKLMLHGHNRNLIWAAVRATSILAVNQDASMKSEVARFPNLPDRLEEWLPKGQSSAPKANAPQDDAVWVLVQLTHLGCGDQQVFWDLVENS